MALLATIMVGASVTGLFNTNPPFSEYLANATWQGWASFALLVLSGLLLTALLSITAYTLFAKKWTKRIVTATIVIIIAGVVAFSSGVSSFMLGSWQNNGQAYDSRIVSRANLSDEFTSVKKLTVDTGNVDLGKGNSTGVYVSYIVSDKPRYELSVTNHDFKPIFTIDGASATLKITANKKSKTNYYDQPTLTVYGPALDEINIKSGMFDYYNKDRQETLNVTVTGSFEASGNYGTVNIITDEAAADATFSNATVESLNVVIRGGYVTAGVVRNLSVDQSDVCPANSDSRQNRVVVRAISGSKLRYNNADKPASTITTACGEVIIGSETAYDEAHNFSE